MVSKKFKPRIKARIRKNKQAVNKTINNFFEWIKGSKLVELKECNTVYDPVRPELDNDLELVMAEKFMALSIKEKCTLLCVLLLPIKFLQVLRS